MPAKKKETLEQALEKLEAIVCRLEGGELPLEESLKLFEEGSALVASCQRQLDQAQQKVTKILKKEDDSPQEVPFAVEDEA